MVIFSRSLIQYSGFSRIRTLNKMKLVAALALCMVAVAEAGIAYPLFFPNNLVFPYELRKAVSFTTKPVFPGYSTQFLKPDLFGGLQLYTFPLLQHQPLYYVPALKTVSPQTLVANARAASGVGVADSSVVAHSDEAVPYSVVANAGPGAAYSSAVVHPNGKSIPVAAGAHASVTGEAH